MYGMRHFIKLYMCIPYHIFKEMMVIYVIKAWEGAGVVASARKLIGSTDPLQAEPGTIRGDLAVQTGRLVLFRIWTLRCIIKFCLSRLRKLFLSP